MGWTLSVKFLTTYGNQWHSVSNKSILKFTFSKKIYFSRSKSPNFLRKGVIVNTLVLQTIRALSQLLNYAASAKAAIYNVLRKKNRHVPIKLYF